jgi:hypothetical protein
MAAVAELVFIVPLLIKQAVLVALEFHQAVAVVQ